MSEMKKLTAGTVEAYERAEEVSYQAAIQMERDTVQITADMTPEEVINTMMPYYMRPYQTTDQEEPRSVIVEVYERAEEVSCQAMIQMRKDNVQITADMTPEEIIRVGMPYYKRHYQATEEDQV